MFVLHRVSLIVTVLRDYGYMALSLIFAELKETVGWAWAKACALLSAIPGFNGDWHMGPLSGLCLQG